MGKSKARVAKLNALNPEPVFGITSMSDRHPEEQFKKGLRMPVDFVPTAPVKQYIPRNSGGVNWGVTEVVTAVKNQCQCGSCWAFSATQAVESQLVLTSGGYRVDLSAQQITSCTPSTDTYGCYGCDGGWTEGAYDYLTTVAGLANSFYIPYEQSLTERPQPLRVQPRRWPTSPASIRCSRVLTPRLLVITMRQRHARQALAASKISRAWRQLWRLLPFLCA